MESRSCVTTMNGFPAFRQRAASSFWTPGSSHRGMAFPKSPLAITISSAAGKSSSKFRTPCIFSILAKIRTFPAPAERSASLSSIRSPHDLTNGCMTPVTPYFAARRMFSRSLSVRAGIGIVFPATARLFSGFIMPPRHTFASAVFPLFFCMTNSSLPSSRSTVSFGSIWERNGAGTGRPPSPKRRMLFSCAGISSGIFPMRSSGPRRSIRISGRFTQPAAAF